MKTTLLYVLVVFSLSAVVWLSRELAGIKVLIKEQGKADKDPIEIADVMTKLQRHAGKLWFSGLHNNWELAEFYVEELEESMKEISGRGIEEEGVNISGLMDIWGLSQIENLEKAIAKRDTIVFRSTYLNLINGCNECHKASKYPYVVVKTPDKYFFDNQSY